MAAAAGKGPRKGKPQGGLPGHRPSAGRGGETPRTDRAARGGPRTGDARPATGGSTDAAQAAAIADLVAPALEDLGFEVVRVQLSGGRGAKPKLQILAERQDGGMSVADCATASRTVSALLDVEDPIAGSYVLEVASPGIDRPLTRLKDFERWAGFEARVELVAPREGQRRFSGPLVGVAGDEVVIDTQEGRKHLPFAEIAKAKLAMTEALLRKTAPKRSKD